MAASFWVVQQGNNPSTDFFIRPLLAAAGVRVDYYCFDQLPARPPTADTRVILVRYVPPRWKAVLDQYPALPLIYFMDDDLFDWRAFRGMPLHYQRKLLTLAWRHQHWLQARRAHLWVSSPWLAEKYAGWRPELLAPHNPHGVLTDIRLSRERTLFYHGTASHHLEWNWLVPIVRQVLERVPEACFEIIGDRRLRARFADIPRVHVLHPMDWPTYQALLKRRGRRVGLAPLCGSTFNQARSPTKFFDITATGAVGIYADHPVYRRRIRSGEDGILCAMDSSQAWVDAAVRLLCDDAYSQRLLVQALEASRTWAGPALEDLG